MKKKPSIIKKTNYFIVTQKSYPAETCKIVDLILQFKEPGIEDVHIPMKYIEQLKGVQYIKKEDMKAITKPLFEPLEFQFEKRYILFAQLQSAEVEMGEGANRELHIKLGSISAPLYDYVKTSPYYKSSIESLALNAKAYYLYNLMAFYRYKTTFALSIEEIKEYMQCTTSYYNSTSEFLKKIIRPAIAEIHEKTTMRISYKKANLGRAITDLEFTVSDTTLALPSSDFSDIDYGDTTTPVVQDDELSKNQQAAIQWKEMEDRIKDQINYEYLADGMWANDIERIDGFVSIMAEVFASNAAMMRINQCEIPMAKVKETFSKINEYHINYILEQMYTHSPDIKNQRSYIITMLYNSVSEFDNYIETKVGYDLYPEGRDIDAKARHSMKIPDKDEINEDLREIIENALSGDKKGNSNKGI